MRIIYFLCCTFDLHFVHFACATWTEEVYGLQQPVLHLAVSVNKSFCACTWDVCLQEPVLHLDVSVFKSAALVSVYKSFAKTKLNSIHIPPNNGLTKNFLL